MSVARQWRIVRNLHPLSLSRSPWRQAAAPSNSWGSRWVAEDSAPWLKATLSLLIIQRQKLDGIHCSIACHWISPGSTWPLARGSPKSRGVPAARAAQGSPQSKPGSGSWRHTVLHSSSPGRDTLQPASFTLQQALEKPASQPGLHVFCFLIPHPLTNKSLYKHSDSEGIKLK